MRMEIMPKISIIIPVYNVDKYINECIESAINQTERDIEIICINDASTDKSLSILREYEEKETRIKVINHPENKGRSQTRKDGVMAAAGEYIMFLDGDDFLSPDACMFLYRKIKDLDVDFVQFDTSLISNEDVSKEMMEWVTHFMHPSEEIVEGNILRAGLIERRFNPNLWNKIWKTDLCKKAFGIIKDKRYDVSEDRYATFLLFYFANSYAGCEKKFYHYRIGVGVTGNDSLSLYQFAERCKGAEIAKEISGFLKREGVEEKFKYEYEEFKKEMLMDCIDCWHNKLDEKESERGFQILVKNWGIKDTIGGIASRYFEEQKDILKRSGVVTADNVAIYYRYIGYDAMDPVLDRTIKENKGKNLYLLTDEDAISKEENYKDVPLYHIASATSSNWDKYVTRCQDLLNFIKENEITEIIYLSPTSHVVELDRLIALSAKVVFSLQMDEYEVDAKTKLKKELETEIEKNKKNKEEYFTEVKKRKEAEEENKKNKEEIHSLHKERDFYISERENLSRNMNLLCEKQKELRKILQEIYAENNHIKSNIKWLNREKELLKCELLKKNQEIEDLEKTKGYKALKMYWNVVKRVHNMRFR